MNKLMLTLAVATLTLLAASQAKAHTVALITFDRSTASQCQLLHKGETAYLSLGSSGFSLDSKVFWEGSFTGFTSEGDPVSGYGRITRGRRSYTFEAEVLQVGASCELHNLRFKTLVAAVD